MKNTVIRTQIPWQQLGEVHLAIAVGNLAVDVGEIVNVRDMTDKRRYNDQFVRDVLHVQIMDTPQAVCEAYGCAQPDAFRRLLVERTTIGIPAEAIITIVMLGDPESAPPLYAEEEEISDLSIDEDIPEMVFPREDLTRWTPEDEELDN